MRAITLNGFGGTDVLTVSEIAKPVPKADELLVRVKAAGINRADLLQRRGKYPAPAGASDILGMEIAGIVEAVGENVTLFKVGDPVCGLVGGGGYAEFCVINQSVAIYLSWNIPFTAAAAIPEAFLTAYEALVTLAQLQKGETVLIHAGASGVGTAAIQLANAIGATVFATVGSLEKKSRLKNFPIKQIIDYKQENFSTVITDITQKSGVNVILDFIGADYLQKNLQSLATGGRLICIGLMGGATAEINLDTILSKRLQIKGLRMRTRSLADKSLFTQQFIKNFLPLFAEGKLKPIVDSVFPIEKVREAHEYMEANRNVGKIILEL